jgi:serine phosphatase RsbU (regulator of sigma subunit)
MLDKNSFQGYHNGDLMIEELDNKINAPKKLVHDIKNIYTRNKKIMEKLDEIIDVYEGGDSSINSLEKTLKKFKKQEEIAKNMQTAIFPSILPNNKIISVTAKLLSMDETSGDFYDVFEVISNSVYGVLLADISGHGVSAALITNLAKMLFIKASERYTSPKDVMKYVNNEICQILHQRSYFTAVYVLVDFPNKQVVHCSAGHPYAMRYNAKTKSIEKITTDNMVIGVSQGREFVEEALDFNVGDKIILYTDGISEARDEEKEMYGDERLKKLILENIEAPSKEILDLVEYDVKQFTGREKFDDDVTMLIIDIKSDEDSDEEAQKSKAFHTKDETTRLIEYYKRSIKLKENHKDKEGVIKDMRKLAAKLLDKGLTDEGFQYLENAKKMADEISNQKLIGDVYFEFALYYDNSGEYDKALDYFNKAYEFLSNEDDKDGISAIYNNISIIHYRKGDIENAKKYIYKAIDILSKLERNQKHMRSMALYYNNLGVNYTNQNNIEKSLEYFIKSNELAEKYDYLKLLATTYNNIGTVYIKRNELEKALKSFYKGLNILDEIEHKSLLSTICQNIAWVYFNQGEKELSLYYFRKAIKVSMKYHIPYSEIINRTLRSYVMIKLGKIYDCLLDIKEVIKIRKKIKINPNDTILHLSLALVVDSYEESSIKESSLIKEDIEDLYNEIIAEYDNNRDPEYYFEKAFEISSNPMVAEDYLRAQFDYATYLYKKGGKENKEKAVSILKDANKIAEKYNEILSILKINSIIKEFNIDEKRIKE